MPQLSPMMGVIVFTLTNLSFFIVVLSIRMAMNLSSVSNTENSSKSNKAFRSFS